VFRLYRFEKSQAMTVLKQLKEMAFVISVASRLVNIVLQSWSF
jgi:hypothetical protein